MTQRPLVTSEAQLVRFVDKKYGHRKAVMVGEAFQETKRTATCPLHRRKSTDYNGVNSDGLVFLCGDWTTGQVKLYYKQNPDATEQRVAGISHYFVADADVTTN